jgi:ribose-phosphate pyrophosphokinase
MLHLNLAEPENSEIKYTVSNFPDGQHLLTVKGVVLHDLDEIREKEVRISSRFNSFIDLEMIICAAQALRELRVKSIHLFLPYVLGGRSDRKFSEGSSNYIKNVIAPILNSQKFESITCLDPHSDVLEACLDNFKKIDNTYLVKFALQSIYGDSAVDQSRFCLVSPDAGALKKVYHVAESIGYTDSIIIASKHRDLKTGKITHTEVTGVDQHSKKDFIIIDDICDGGRTFIEIAKVLSDIKASSKIYLIVTHGIFSAGFDELEKYFTGIFTTDSVGKIPESVSFIKQQQLF